MKAVICLVITCLFGFTNAYAYTGFDICNFGNEKVDTIICYGPAVLKDTTIAGDVKVAGPLKANNISAGAMHIAGSATVQQSKVLGPADISGPLYAEKVTFEKGLNVSANSVTLHGTRVKGSMVITSQATKPYLKMECGSIITGGVTFDGMEGVIQVTDDSMVQGKIVNGTLEFIRKKCS